MQYNVTKRDILSAWTYKIGLNADFGHNTEWVNSYHGERYSYEHDFTKRVNIVFQHEHDDALYTTGVANSEWITLGYTF